MSNPAQELGKWGEKLAADFLIKLGYAIIARNVRTPYGEVDLIAQQPDKSNPDGMTIVFVEVKTRLSDQFGSPLDALTFHKCRQISKVALEYLIKNGGIDQPARFDVVAVRPGAAKEVELVRNAFDLCYGV